MRAQKKMVVRHLPVVCVCVCVGTAERSQLLPYAKTLQSRSASLSSVDPIVHETPVPERKK